jgi:hypothetical protein
MKAGRENKIVKNKINKIGVEDSKERSVEYSAVGCKVIATFIIIFRMCRREGV